MTAWNKEDDEILTREWATGMDTRQIALLLSVARSKNSVIGRAHRLGLAQHSRAHKRGKRPTREKKAREIFTPVEPIVGEPRDGSDGWTDWPLEKQLGIDDIGRSENGCKWPVGEKALEDDFYCGMPRRDDRCSYCPAHAKRAYVKSNGPARGQFVLRYIRG